jgi:uncharacterized protein YecE (DUF72 family)
METKPDCKTTSGSDGHPNNRQPARIGCAGWSIPRDAGRYFTNHGTHLERYARILNACEINSSFYRPHKPATWERWSDSVPAGFRFAVKMPKAITHHSALNCSSEALAAFLQQVSFLHEKLGALLVQLPSSLEFEHGRTHIFLSHLRDLYGGDVAWEPRHSSWFSEKADELLRKFCVARAAADPPCVPAATQPGGFARFAYFRLHGSPRRYYSAYSEEFIGKIADQIAILAASARVWCVFDNTAAGHAIENALQLAARLRAK